MLLGFRTISRLVGYISVGKRSRDNRTSCCDLVPGTWLLFSSGARPEYLENDVRALALLPDTDIQFRYSKRWVCPEFIKAVSDGDIVGSTAYITYLDAKTSTFVLVRETSVAGCYVRGSSYILRLTAKRYFNHPEHPDLETRVASLATHPTPAFDASGKLTAGAFVVPVSKALNFNDLVEHDNDDTNPRHLNAFEATIEKLGQHADFQKIERGLFVNLIDVRDDSNLSVQLPQVRNLKAGKTYKITLYHYLTRLVPQADWKPFWIKVQSDNKNVRFQSDINLMIESGYDERDIVFSLDPDMPSEKIGIDIRLIALTEQGETVLKLYLPFQACRKLLKPVIQAAVIAAGLIGPQLAPDGWKVAAAVVGALFVAGTTVSGLKREL